MKLIIRISAICVCSLMTANLHAQSDSLGTKVIDIVKSYTPSIANASKLPEKAPARDTMSLKKKKIEYIIYSVPVASTFVPEKGKVLKLSSVKKQDFFNSYAALGFGSYTTILADAFVNLPLTPQSDFSVAVQHHSSQQGVKEAKPDSNFSLTNAQVQYQQNTQKYNLRAFANFGMHQWNWYGIENQTLSLTNLPNLKQKFLYAGAGASVTVNEGILKDISLKVNGLRDDFKSNEIQIDLKPKLAFHISDVANLETLLDVNYLNGSFDRLFNEQQKSTYQNFALGISPTFNTEIQDFKLKIGLGFYYVSSEQKIKESVTKIFPEVKISYVANTAFAPFVGATGSVRSNSYRNFSLQNPYLSPTLQILPSFKPYEIFAGAEGALPKNLSYQAKIFYSKTENLPMFIANPWATSEKYGYELTNSFSALYDDVMSYGAQAEINGNINQKHQVGVRVNYTSYVPEKQEKAWNLPEIGANIYANFQIIPNWNAGTELFFVGERHDVSHHYHLLSNASPLRLKSFFDANLSTSYTLARRWTIFLKANNILNQNYTQWSFYPVQGFQILGGLCYQFNVK